ncbi:MAG: GxxExxY protein, partial [Acetobacteraceae bacterium]
DGGGPRGSRGSIERRTHRALVADEACGASTGWQCCEGSLGQEGFDADEGGWTQMHADEGRLDELSRTVIGGAFTVINTLGAGFLDKVYENALTHEPRKAGCAVEQQHGITVMYDGKAVGTYFVDLLVEEVLLVELKTVPALNAAHRGRCVNSLKATRLPLCLLPNFGNPRLDIKRVANHL